MSILTRTRTIAKQVRTWAEKKAEDANYNPDNLCGWCAIASGQLFKRLQADGIAAEIHINSGHTFLVVEDHIVDITATQFHEFGNKPVLIIHQKEIDENEHWFYAETKVFKSIAKLHAFQVKEKWPAKQCVLLTE